MEAFDKKRNFNELEKNIINDAKIMLTSEVVLPNQLRSIIKQVIENGEVRLTYDDDYYGHNEVWFEIKKELDRDSVLEDIESVYVRFDCDRFGNNRASVCVQRDGDRFSFSVSDGMQNGQSYSISRSEMRSAPKGAPREIIGSQLRGYVTRGNEIVAYEDSHDYSLGTSKWNEKTVKTVQRSPISNSLDLEVFAQAIGVETFNNHINQVKEMASSIIEKYVGREK